MSLLDELGNEADAARRRRAQEQSGAQQAEDEVRARLLPAIVRSHAYFDDFCRHVNDLDRTVRFEYPLPGGARLRDLEQQGYAVHADEGRGLERFGLHFRCCGAAALELAPGNDALLASSERTLKDSGLRVRRRHDGVRAPTLLVEAEVPVTLTFSLDVSRVAVLLVARNLFGLGEQVYRFDAQRVNTELLDELGRCVLRQPNRFARLCGNTVDEDSRKALARQLAREHRRREAELGGRWRRALFPLLEWIRRNLLRQ